MRASAMLVLTFGACASAPAPDAAAPVPVPVPAPVPAPSSSGGPVLPATCDVLPGAVPSRLVLEVARRGGEPGTTRRFVVPRGVPCPEPTPHEARLDEGNGSTRACASVDDAALAALWTRLRALALERVSTYRVEGPSPHRGGLSLHIAWEGGACALSDILDSAIADVSRTSFDAAVAAIDDAFLHGAPAGGPCVAEPSPPPILADYGAAATGTRHRVRVAWDESARAWGPSPQLDMPLHHASRFAWENLAAYPVLDGWHALPLVFTVTIVDRTIEPPAGRGGEYVFFATYRARVESVCGVD